MTTYSIVTMEMGGRRRAAVVTQYGARKGDVLVAEFATLPEAMHEYDRLTVLVGSPGSSYLALR